MRTVNLENYANNPIKAKDKRSDLTDSYGFVSSENVLATFNDAGWVPVSQQAVLPRKDINIGFQKHLVRLEHPEYQSIPGLEGDAHSRPQLVMVNSHDKGSSLRLTWGMIRFACANGLIMGDAVSEVRLNHSSKVAERLPDAIAQVLESFPRLIEQAQTLRRIQLTPAATAKLVQTVYDARLDGVQGLLKVDYRLPTLRTADQGSDAFTVFNKVQERVLRGGIHYLHERKVTDRYGITSTTTSGGKTRAVTAIGETIRLNELAYNTALELVA